MTKMSFPVLRPSQLPELTFHRPETLHELLGLLESGAHPIAGGLVEDIEAQVVDGDDRPLPAGEVGFARFRGPGFATSYLDNPEATARAFRDGWFYPMDLAAINEDGYVFLKGRADDIISCDGIKFYPIEVETVLMSHPAVTAAAVFGWPHSLHGEESVAAVTVTEPASQNDIRSFCTQRMAEHMVPRIIMIMPELPRNPMGKILKGEIKETLKRKLAKRS